MSIQVLPRPTEVLTPVLKQRVRKRSILLGLGALLLLFIALVLEVALGKYHLSPTQILEILRGGGERLERTIVFEWRIPRALVGMIAGACLGSAGAITQTMTRNPLASPDLLGIAMGASAAAVAVMVLAPHELMTTMGPVLISAAALVGGILTAIIVLGIAFRGGLDSTRMLLTGIGIQAIGGALVSMILVLSTINQAADAVGWLVGSITGARWRDVAVISVLASIGAVLLVWGSFYLKALALDKDSSTGIGVPHNRVVLSLWLLAVILTAATVSVCGPIGFVALMAPQIARLLWQSPAPPLIPSALCGALVILGADLAARLILPDGLPVGVITAAFGGPALVIFLLRFSKKVSS